MAECSALAEERLASRRRNRRMDGFFSIYVLPALIILLQSRSC